MVLTPGLRQQLGDAQHGVSAGELGEDLFELVPGVGGGHCVQLQRRARRSVRRLRLRDTTRQERAAGGGLHVGPPSDRGPRRGPAHPSRRRQPCRTHAFRPCWRAYWATVVPRTSTASIKSPSARSFQRIRAPVANAVSFVVFREMVPYFRKPAHRGAMGEESGCLRAYARVSRHEPVRTRRWWCTRGQRRAPAHPQQARPILQDRALRPCWPRVEGDRGAASLNRADQVSGSLVVPAHRRARFRRRATRRVPGDDVIPPEASLRITGLCGKNGAGWRPTVRAA